MIALEITNVKDFMNKLLVQETFDNFLLQEACIVNGASFVIDGHITEGYYTEEEISENSLEDKKMLPFSMLKGKCFDLIKGKKTPHSFRFVFLLSPENTKKTLEATSSTFTENDISGMFINLKFQNQLLTLTTGVGYNIFSVDKSLDREWDSFVKKFLSKYQIDFEEIS